MKIESLNNRRQTTFGSRNCPINPFSIHTQNGTNLLIKEMDLSDNWKAAKFTFDCTVSCMPEYEYKMSFVDKIKNLTNFAERNIGILTQRDGNGTILVAKNENGDIKGVFSMKNFDRVYGKWRTPKNIKTGYIPECYIANEFQNEGIGSVMLNKLLETAKGQFSDVLLHARNSAVNFYKKLGFEPLDYSNPEIKKIPGYVLPEMRNIATIMSKSIDPTDPWWAKAAKYY